MRLYSYVFFVLFLVCFHVPNLSAVTELPFEESVSSNRVMKYKPGMEIPPLQYSTGDMINRIYQLMYDSDYLFRRNKLEYWIEGGTLLGSLRHKGVIPWDDDADIQIHCESPNQSCWSQLFDKKSKLRTEMAEWGLQIFDQGLEYNRHIIKIYNEKNYTEAHWMGFTFPYIDVFLVNKIRCNVTLDGKRADYHNLELPTPMVEKTIYAYSSSEHHYQPGHCEVRTNYVEYIEEDELFPMKNNYIFGEYRLIGPNNPDRSLKRTFGPKYMDCIHQPFIHAVHTTTPFKSIQFNLINYPKEVGDKIRVPGQPMQINHRTMD